jgi:hypothetical protein
MGPLLVATTTTSSIDDTTTTASISAVHSSSQLIEHIYSMMTSSEQPSDSKAHRKRRVQQCLKQIKAFIIEHRADPISNKIGTVDALHRTLELLRTAVQLRYSPDRGASSSIDTWIDSSPPPPLHHQQLADDVWSLTNADLNERLLVTVKVSLPDGW